MKRILVAIVVVAISQAVDAATDPKISIIKSLASLCSYAKDSGFPTNQELDACVKDRTPRSIFDDVSELDRIGIYKELRSAHQSGTVALDNVDEKYLHAVSKEANNDKGNWQVSVKSDPITDEQIVTMTLIADSGVGNFGDPIALTLRCANGEPDAIINWQSFMTDSAEVATRVDRNPPEILTWNSDTSKTASFYPTRPHPVRKTEYREASGGKSAGHYVVQLDASYFIKELIGGSSLVARATPYNEKPITVTWKLSGIVAASAGLRRESGVRAAAAG